MIFVKFSIEILDLLLDKTLGHFLWSNLWENPGIYDISKYKIPYVELVRHIITLIAPLFSVKQAKWKEIYMKNCEILTV